MYLQVNKKAFKFIYNIHGLNNRVEDTRPRGDKKSERETKPQGKACSGGGPEYRAERDLGWRQDSHPGIFDCFVEDA